MKYPLLLASLGSIIFTGCSGPEEVNLIVRKPVERSFSFDTLPREGIVLEQKATGRISVKPSPDNSANSVLCTTVNEGDTVNNGNRAELVIRNSDSLYTEVWHQWKFYIPKETHRTSGDGWFIIGQFHDQPDTSIGEKWSTYPGHSPMVGFNLREDSNGVMSLDFSHGISQKIPSWNMSPISAATWHTVTAHIRWSTETDGFAEAWLDGKPFTGTDGSTRYEGITMFNRAPAYLKLGVYRARGSIGNVSVLYDEYRGSATKPRF